MNRISSLFLALALLSVNYSCAHRLPSSDQMGEINKSQALDENADLDASKIISGASSIGPEKQHHRQTYFLYGAEHLKLDNYYYDIPVVYNDAVRKWLDYFQNKGRAYFERYSARAGRYAPVMGKILEEMGLPRDLIFLAMAESGFQTKAKSWARAVGPWQFMPFTGKRYGLKIDWYVDERMDPIKATIAAGKYLKKLFEEFGSWELAAAAYNAGEGKMNRAIQKYNTENFWQLTEGRYLKRETKNYVPKIMALAIIGKNLKAFGFEDIDFHEPLDFEELEVSSSSDLFMIGEALGVPDDEIFRLNPEIMRWYTPPYQEKYSLRVPVGMTAVWEGCCKNQEFTASKFQDYKVRGNNTRLSDVARKFKIAPYVMEQLNDKTANHRLHSGEMVRLPFRVGQSHRDNMYADLYELPRKSVLRRRQYKDRLKIARRRGTRITDPKAFYVVQRGDTLWEVARKNNISLDTLILSNMGLVKNRMIRAGDKLVVR